MVTKKLKKLPESNKQAIKFIIIGIMAVVTDMICYYLLLSVIPEKIAFLENEMLAKGLSFLCGFSVTYTFNNRWTWRKTDHNQSRFLKFIALYGISLILNVLLNSTLLYLILDFKNIIVVPKPYFVAFIGATGFSSVFNFLGQKFWVFKNQPIFEED